MAESASRVATTEVKSAAKLKAAEEVTLVRIAETRTKALEDARAEAAARERAEEEAKAKEELDALAAEEARVAAEARRRSEQKAKAKAEAEALAAEHAKLAAAAKIQARKQIKARAAEEARLKALLAQAEAAEQAQAARPLANPADDPIAADTSEPQPAKKPRLRGILAKKVWFYTCEGERLGPVSFEELRAMAAGSSLDPRLDMVWKKGTDDWTPAGQIDGLFERRNVHAEIRKTKVLPAISHPLPPQVPRSPLLKPVSWPGATRRSLWFMTLAFPLLWQIGLNQIGPFLIKRFETAPIGKILSIAALLPAVLLAHVLLRRLTNLGMSRWWSLALFAPVLNLWLGFRCFACPPGYARHKKLDGPGIALAISYGLILLAGVVALAIPSSPPSTTIKNLNLPGSLPELVRFTQAYAHTLHQAWDNATEAK